MYLPPCVRRGHWIDAFLVNGLYAQFDLPAVLEDERG
jgi:hypothetical protein